MESTTIINTNEQSHLRTCARCGLTYDWRRSPSSSLKMTYCGSLCERGDLGFTIDAILHSEFRKAPTEPLPWEAEPAEPVAA